MRVVKLRSPDEELYLQSSASVFLALLGVDVNPMKGVNTELSPRRVVEVYDLADDHYPILRRWYYSARNSLDVQQVVSGLLSSFDAIRADMFSLQAYIIFIISSSIVITVTITIIITTIIIFSVHP
ncbi:hypothetical protein AK812_SmicGene35477 [Symbiodinium microadriaticum]|uniref:Uncharacterized protein n=1 Tax=Symbiodinium microadriaticum TaxID=2951 RepID=A0A1Q9CLD6_SYMMI|nr:hypothetical protein AK812_SmicGene35477 [Symbiodinium microadriaticum]